MLACGTHQVVEARTDQYVLCGGVPLHVANSPLVSVQVHQPLCEVGGQPTIWDVPQLHSAVITTGRNDVVVEWVPLDVQDWTFVTSDARCVEVKSTCLLHKTIHIRLNLIS